MHWETKKCDSIAIFTLLQRSGIKAVISLRWACVCGRRKDITWPSKWDNLAGDWRCVCWWHTGLYVIWFTSIKCFSNPEVGDPIIILLLPLSDNRWAECLVYNTERLSNLLTLEYFQMFAPVMQPGVLPNLLLKSACKAHFLNLPTP